MNTYICLDCGKTHSNTCPCGSGRQQACGDIHLGSKFVDAYVDVQNVSGRPSLIIKKASGQVVVPLQTRDLLPGF